MFTETHASSKLNTGSWFEVRIKSLLSFKDKSENFIAAFGKCLNGVKDRSENVISP